MGHAIALILIERYAQRKANDANHHPPLLQAGAEQGASDEQLAEAGLVVKQPAEEFRFQDIFTFNRTYWYLTASCFLVYGAILPYNNIANKLLQHKYDISEDHADNFLLIPFLIGAIGSPFLGFAVDFFGRRSFLITVSASILVLSHLLLAFVDSAQLYPAVPQVMIGIAYSIYAAAIWPSVSLVVDEANLGTAYGVITALQNFGLTVVPLIVGAIQSKTDTYIWCSVFFAAFAAVGTVFGVLVVIEDLRAGGILSKPSQAFQGAAADAEAQGQLRSPVMYRPLMQNAAEVEGATLPTQYDHPDPVL